ncbi:unnamed protein product, partial [marine sediment metagenome]
RGKLIRFYDHCRRGDNNEQNTRTNTIISDHHRPQNPGG